MNLAGTNVFDGGFEVAILLGRGMPPGEQLRSLAEIGRKLVTDGIVGRVEVAFAEFTEPALEQVVHRLADEGVRSCVVVPVIVPYDRNLGVWLGRWLSRWAGENAGALRVVLADPIDEVGDLGAPVAGSLLRAGGRADIRDAVRPLKLKAGASSLPPTAKMVMVCLGARRLAAGGLDIYKRIYGRFGSYRPAGLDDERLLCLRTNCHGPCNFGPLVAVQPDGVWYGQLTLPIVDEIIERHLAHGGSPLAEYALRPSARLRLADGRLAELGGARWR